VDFLPANIELSGLEVSLVNVMSREYVLREALWPLRERYDHILIDCMPSLGMMTINALAASDRVLVPTQANYLSTKGLSLLMGSIAKVKRQINPRLRMEGVLLTMVDHRTNNAKAVIASLGISCGSLTPRSPFLSGRRKPAWQGEASLPTMGKERWQRPTNSSRRR
jgi:chromosome partitioning protein